MPRLILLTFLFLAPLAPAAEHLPQSLTFPNKTAFNKIVATAQQQNWRALPMGERVAKFGLAMRGTPYVGYTLEIHDHTESASANFSGLDCWTFFEIALGLARMIEVPKPTYTPSDLLAEIEWTRYRGGVCNGNYLDRIHYLAEWYYDNEARGNVVKVTTKVGPTVSLVGRKCQEMTVLWKGYRYLRKNPSLLPQMAKIEARESALPFRYIHKSKVAAIEKNIQPGDIIGIVTKHTGGHCSHVGLAYRGSDGVMRLMHASRNYKKVVIDKSISGYLHEFNSHIGIIVARPLPRSQTIREKPTYLANLQRLTTK
ncbi:DUF1460 domain-containing protein [Phragmitibacter flavus]|uniref:DUF1460 domain-containing protein n=1 Tax=Phragmitibacter flavus TaxID=2576071 RepID=A0A5R8KEL0_9BACT|nr:N-acetylmuramoyl-L-alanine amidase-like domain-containing protein [Phragmitibacter flavus]TLD70720.1 DUF1460 domain-containing protein [Phragmitibacter flavus]